MTDESIPQRRCYKCGEIKLLTDFVPDRSKASGYRYLCRICKRATGKEYESRPEIKARRQQQEKTRIRKPREAYPYNPAQRRRNRLRKLYGITQEDFNRLAEQQNGVCAICGEPPPQNKKLNRLYVDHNHETGQVRGLLCNNCNTAIGQLRDSLDIVLKAAAYLRRHA